MTSGATAHASPPADGGVGWRASFRDGDIDRRDGAVRFETSRGRLDLEASRVGRESGVRAQGAFGLALIDGGLFVARPIRESFALVDAKAPGVGVMQDNRRIGVTDGHGRRLVTDLRAYEDNRLAIAVDDLPVGMSIAADALTVMPPARAGAIARFAVLAGVAGEVRIVDRDGTPLAEGVILVRDGDGARFPVGEEGRVYVDGVRDDVRLRRTGEAGCVASISADTVLTHARVVCRRSVN